MCLNFGFKYGEEKIMKNWLVLFTWFFLLSTHCLVVTAVESETIPDELIKRAKQGDAKAQRTLSRKYEKRGWKQKKDNPNIGETYLVTSFTWMMLSATQGYSPAFSDLADKYKKGYGVDIDLKKAQYWYERWNTIAEKKAMAGDANLQFHLGRKYSVGVEGKVKDYGKAIFWYDKAGQNGNTSALNRLGGFYFDGYVVKRDLYKAQSYYKQSASLGDGIGKVNYVTVSKQIKKHKVWKEGNQNDISITVSRSHFAPELIIVYSPYCTKCLTVFNENIAWLKDTINKGKLTVRMLNIYIPHLKNKQVKKDISNLFNCISEEKSNLDFLYAFSGYSRFVVANAEKYNSDHRVSAVLVNKYYDVLRDKHQDVTQSCIDADINDKKQKIRAGLKEAKIQTVPSYLYANKIYTKSLKEFTQEF